MNQPDEARCPTVGRNTELEELSRRYFRQQLPPAWVLGGFERDFGVDGIVQVVENCRVTGLQFSVQLKASDRLRGTGEHVLHPCGVKTLRHFRERVDPTMFVVYDARSDLAYYVWIQDYLDDLSQRRPHWVDQNQHYVKIRRTQVLTRDSAAEIVAYVRLYFGKTPERGFIRSRQALDHITLPTLFISYVTTDRGFVRRLATDLAVRGVNVWCDFWEIKAGDAVARKIERGVQDCDYFAIVLSPESVALTWVWRELATVLSREKAARKVTVLPLLYRDCPTPLVLAGRSCPDFRRNYDHGLTAVMKTLLRTKERGVASTAIFSSRHPPAGTRKTDRAISVVSPKTGERYFLHAKRITLRGGLVQTVYYFSRQVRTGALATMPPGYRMAINPRTGLPLLGMEAYELGPRLGPFYETHGIELIPIGYEESAERLAQALGPYVVMSNIRCLDNTELRVDHYDLTRFIQEDWDRVSAGQSPRGFLLCYRAGAFAAGRVAEEVILRRLLRSTDLFGQPVQEVLHFWQAVERGLVRRRVGLDSDDLVVRLANNVVGVVEAKASFHGSSYLRRSIQKIAAQLVATLGMNPTLTFVLVALINLEKHTIVVAGTEREHFVADPIAWLRANVESHLSDPSH